MQSALRSIPGKSVFRIGICFLIIISVLLCAVSLAPAIKVNAAGAKYGYTAKIKIKTINDADGWNSAWLKLYAKKDYGTGSEYEVWHWQDIRSSVDDSGDVFESEMFCSDGAFPSKIEVYTDFGGGITLRKWEGEVTIYVNGVNVKKENISSNSGIFTSSNDTNTVTIDRIYYPIPQKINISTYDKQVLPDGDPFGKLYQQAGTDKCQGQAFVTAVDQYNVVWHRNFGSVRSLDYSKVYTYDSAENITSPSTDKWEKGGYETGDTGIGQMITLTSTSGVDHQSQYKLTFKTANFLIPTVTRTFDVYFVFRHKVKVMMGDSELLTADDISGKWVNIDPVKFTSVPKGYKVKELTKTSGAGKLEKNDNGKYQFTFSISDAVLSAETEPIKYTVYFNGNGGTGNINFMNMTYDKTTRLPSNSFIYKGKHFIGWNTKANGKGTAFENRVFVKNLTDTDGGSVTLYAQWEDNVYDVTLNYPDEIMSLPEGLKPYTSQSVKHGGDISVPEIIKTNSDDGHYKFVSSDSSLKNITSDAEIELTYEKGSHSFGAPVVTKAPDCTHKGEQIRICEDCGYEEITELEEVHQGLVVTPEKLPTCTEAGLTETKYCETCKKWIDKGEEIPASGHSYDEPQWKWNDDCTVAEATFACKNCGEISTVKTENSDRITKTEDGDDTDYIATVSFNGQEFTGRYSHDNANAEDNASVIGSVFGNGSVVVIISISVLAVIAAAVVIVMKKRKSKQDSSNKEDSEDK